jgi:hypothetical protein
VSACRFCDGVGVATASMSVMDLQWGDFGLVSFLSL